LTRPGRIDRQIPVPLPDIKGRHKILKIHTRKVKLEPDVDLETIARGTPGFSGADLANLVNQSAIRATKENVHRVRLEDLEWAKDKIIMGSERKSAVITEESKRLTAYHEAGHTLIALLTQGAMPLHKVSVIPRGAALGVTVQLPENDMQNFTKRELMAMIDVCFGGRAAEELIFGEEEVTTGASNDLEKATMIAKEMIAKYGMSVKNGLLTLAAEDDLKNMSSESKSMLENEVREMLHVSPNYFNA
jgi:ATP-dependent metalloprotease